MGFTLYRCRGEHLHAVAGHGRRPSLHGRLVEPCQVVLLRTRHVRGRLQSRGHACRHVQPPGSSSQEKELD